MSDYTVKSGDNLWNICKKQFKLSNNAEIAKKVNDVAKANGISNPNLIFAGKNIELGDAMDKIERTTPTEPTAIAKEYDNWATSKENQEKTWKAYTGDKEPEKPPVADFDFLGVDMTKVPVEKKAETYTNGLLKFSQANILNANTDNDAKTLTFEEFFEKEKKNAESAGITAPTEDAAKKAFNNIDIDGSGKLDDKELSTTYAFMDTSKGTDENSGKMDGKIDHNSVVFTNFSDARMGNKMKDMFGFLFPPKTENQE